MKRTPSSQGLQCGGLFGAKAVVWAFRAAQQICRLRIVQQLFTLLLVVMAAFGLYSYWQHTVDVSCRPPSMRCLSLPWLLWAFWRKGQTCVANDTYSRERRHATSPF